MVRPGGGGGGLIDISYSFRKTNLPKVKSRIDELKATRDDVMRLQTVRGDTVRDNEFNMCFRCEAGVSW